jgi:hypothetical protein
MVLLSERMRLLAVVKLVMSVSLGMQYLVVRLMVPLQIVHDLVSTLKYSPLRQVKQVE